SAAIRVGPSPHQPVRRTVRHVPPPAGTGKSARVPSERAETTRSGRPSPSKSPEQTASVPCVPAMIGDSNVPSPCARSAEEIARRVETPRSAIPHLLPSPSTNRQDNSEAESRKECASSPSSPPLLAGRSRPLERLPPRAQSLDAPQRLRDRPLARL